MPRLKGPTTGTGMTERGDHGPLSPALSHGMPLQAVWTMKKVDAHFLRRLAGGERGCHRQSFLDQVVLSAASSEPQCRQDPSVPTLAPDTPHWKQPDSNVAVVRLCRGRWGVRGRERQ